MNLIDIISKNDRHVTYKRTALHWVIVQVNYASVSDNHYGAYKDFLKSYANVDLTKDQYDGMMVDEVRLKSADNDMWLKLSTNFMQIRLSGRAYRNYSASLAPHVDKFQTLLDNINADIHRINLRKINMWGYKADNDKHNGRDLMKSIFSDNMLNLWDPINETANNENASLTKLIASDPIDGNTGALIAKFGYIESDAPQSMSRIVLDSEYELLSKGDMNGDNLSPILSKINDRLYDLYHSVIRPVVINKMME